MTTEFSINFIVECKTKLLAIKADLLNRIRSESLFIRTLDRGGDEVDQTMALLEENQSLIQQERIRKQFMQIEMALSRIEDGTFGICEETMEPIEIERLRTLPWTTLSIEGAEIRESQTKKYAR